MTIPSANETDIQTDIIDFLQKIGYTYIHPDKMRQYRSSTKQVILKDILKHSISRINKIEYKGEQYRFSDTNIDQAIRDLDVPLVEGLVSSNEKIYDRLILGDSYEEQLTDDFKSSFQLKYIDFENIENNVFHCTEEFSVEKHVEEDKEKHKRADVVLFVNGIPLSVIELKKSSVYIRKGIQQLITYQRKNNIPSFFRYIQIMMAANTSKVKYATVGTPEKFWNIWREEEFSYDDLSDFITDREPTSLDMSCFSLFCKQRLLELMRSFIVYDNNIKKIARYQQFFSVQKIMKNILSFDNAGRRKGGLVWHTQGSGKSLTMVMLARKIQNTISNSRIVIVTDRINLDKQIRRTFYHSGIDVVRARSGKKLTELIEGEKSTVITTVINKFESVMDRKVQTDNPNIFVLVDESHRTQYGTLASRMRNVFPSACYLGFTGTPLKRKDKDSAQKFGGIIHTYTIENAVKDGAVLPLLYEGRFVDQEVVSKSSMDRKFDLISRNLNDAEKADLKKKWTRLQNIVATEERMEVIALNINEHYRRTWQNTGFKAMFATNSKYEAIKYHEIFNTIGEIRSAYIISPPDTKEGYEDIDSENKKLVQQSWEKLMKNYKDAEDYEKRTIDRFVNGDGSDEDDVELLIVVDKLLTGFDAPRAVVLYIDKNIKDYLLLQAIARVNRLYEGKEYGFIMDYRGLLGNLDKALTAYSALNGFLEGDVENIVEDINGNVMSLKQKRQELKDIFSDVKFKDDLESYILELEDDKKREDFYKKLKEYSKKLKICLSSEKFFDMCNEKEIKEYNESLKFHNELRKSARIRYREEVDFSEFEPEMRKLLDTYINAGEVNTLTKIVNIFETDKFDEEVSRVEGSRAKADTIKNAISKVVTEKMDQNPDYYEKISKRIQTVIDEYKNRRISDEAYLESMKEVLDELRRGQENTGEYPDMIKDNRLSLVIYDNTSDIFGEYLENIRADNKEKKIGSLIKGITGVFEHYKYKPDWKHNLDVHKEIDQSILDLLWDFEDEYNIRLETDEIIEKIKKIVISRDEL